MDHTIYTHPSYVPPDMQDVPIFTNNYNDVFLAKPYLGKPLVAERLNLLPRPDMKLMRKMIECMFPMEMLFREKPRERFAELCKKMTPIENGIFKQVISQGFGDPLEKDMQVTVYYTMMMESERQVQNSTYCSCEPFTFILGASNSGVLPGFEQAVMSMKNQEKANFVVPHQLLYGREGWPPQIPPNDNAFITIEIGRVKEIISEKQKVRLHNNFDRVITKVEETRGKAKAAYQAKFYKIAANLYHEALTLLKDVLAQNEADNDKRLELLVTMYLYGGMAFMKCDLVKQGATLLMQAVNLENTQAVKLSDSTIGKLYYQAARVLRMTNFLNMGYMMLIRARELLGHDETERECQEFCAIYKRLYCKVYPNIPGVQQVGSNLVKHRRDEAIVRETLEEMFKSFESSNQNSRTIFGFKYDTNELRVMASKRGIKVRVQQNDDGTTRYLLIKK